MRDYPRTSGGTIQVRGQHAANYGLSPHERGNRVGPRRHVGVGRTIPARAGEPGSARRGWSRCEDYPRTSGGTKESIQERRGGPGLSPHERGNRPRSASSPPGDGTIPARAGEPRGGRGARKESRDYPRTSGGTPRSSCNRRRRLGLSPHERGNRERSAWTGSPVRTIPARAGEPRTNTPVRPDWRDYPRTSGGTAPPAVTSTPVTGLSPHERGNLSCVMRFSILSGTIPARAGEPSSRTWAASQSWDYPRTSGGTARHRPDGRPPLGLSPHERGNPEPLPCGYRSTGTIPARAGEPSRLGAMSRKPWDYPRTSGGTTCDTGAPGSLGGLSPHERGNPLPAALPLREPGTIPARAGEPRRPRGRGWRRWDYPRTSGGTVGAAAGGANAQGLSPHERGNRRIRRRARSGSGTIPARAGEPSTWTRCRTSTWDYPRTSGGTDLTTLRTLSPRGLSPHERGNPVHGVLHGGLRRVANADYPRTSGGTLLRRAAGRVVAGLSPHERGNRDGGVPVPGGPGTIPARAGEPTSRRCARSPRGDYPRTSGGTLFTASSTAASGESPMRTIPARAGEPSCGGRPGEWWRDYPRTSGGTVMGVFPFQAVRGLSPHERGNRVEGQHRDHQVGTIPARAGEPWVGGCRGRQGWDYPRTSGGPRSSSSRSLTIWDYPRTSGGTRPRASSCARRPGLSPHERGNLRLHVRPVSGRGTIPARAGEPLHTPYPTSFPRDYPRTSGGTGAGGQTPGRGWGLSPHERGNHEPAPERHAARGTIPARAGEPPAPRPSSLRARDYPRTSGGTLHCALPDRLVWGLSPHERGNQAPGVDGLERRGTIPARAGEPLPIGRQPLKGRDYPRTSGGTSLKLSTSANRWGLSPHERGNPELRVYVGHPERTIPARAGEPPPGGGRAVEVRTIPARAGEPRPWRSR